MSEVGGEPGPSAAFDGASSPSPEGFFDGDFDAEPVIEGAHLERQQRVRSKRLNPEEHKRALAKRSRNLGESYISSSGKIVPARQRRDMACTTHATSLQGKARCGFQCGDLTEEEQQSIFRE